MKISPLELVVVEGGGKHSRFNLGLPHVILGRLDPGEAAAAGSCLFPEPTVSKVHAVLDWDEKKKRYVITHRSATNATLVNGKPLSKSCHLSPGDKVRMGRLTFELRIGIGQHNDAEIGHVDVAHLTRSVSNTPSETLTWIGNTPLPAARPKPVEPAPVHPAAQAPPRIPPPPRRAMPTPDFSQPYSPTPVDPAAREAPPIPDSVAAAIPSFGNPDEVVAPVVEGPRRIALGPLPPLPPKVNLGNQEDVPTGVMQDKPKLVLRELERAGSDEPPTAEMRPVEGVGELEAAPPTALMRLSESAPDEPIAETRPVEGELEAAPPTAMMRVSESAPETDESTAEMQPVELEAAPPTAVMRASESVPETEEPIAEMRPVEGEAAPTVMMRVSESAPETDEMQPVESQEELEAAPPTAVMRASENAPETDEPIAPHLPTEPQEPPSEADSPPAKTTGKGKGKSKAKSPPPGEQPKQQPFVRAAKKVGRNEKCPCGSGQKYKKCCGA